MFVQLWTSATSLEVNVANPIFASNFTPKHLSFQVRTQDGLSCGSWPWNLWWKWCRSEELPEEQSAITFLSVFVLVIGVNAYQVPFWKRAWETLLPFQILEPNTWVHESIHYSWIRSYWKQCIDFEWFDRVSLPCHPFYFRNQKVPFAWPPPAHLHLFVPVRWTRCPWMVTEFQGIPKAFWIAHIKKCSWKSHRFFSQ